MFSPPRSERTFSGTPKFVIASMNACSTVTAPSTSQIHHSPREAVNPTMSDKPLSYYLMVAINMPYTIRAFSIVRPSTNSNTMSDSCVHRIYSVGMRDQGTKTLRDLRCPINNLSPSLGCSFFMSSIWWSNSPSLMLVYLKSAPSPSSSILQYNVERLIPNTSAIWHYLKRKRRRSSISSNSTKTGVHCIICEKRSTTMVMVTHNTRARTLLLVTFTCKPSREWARDRARG